MTNHFNKILTYIAAAATSLGFVACNDEIDYYGAKIGEPINVSIAIDLPETEDHTVNSRASESVNQQVFDLMVLAFNDRGELTARYFFDDVADGINRPDPAYSENDYASLVLDATTHHSGSVLNLRVPAGPGKLVAAANVSMRTDGLLDKLKAVTTYSEFCALQVPETQYDNIYDIMGGAYMEKDNVTNDNFEAGGECTFINGKLPGKLYLRPVSSRVKVNITCAKNSVNTLTFNLESFQLVNMPANAPLVSGQPAVTASFTSEQNTNFETAENNSFSFNFSMNEYKRTSLKTINTYADRARWDDSKSHAPEQRTWTNAPADAPYIVLRGTYTGKSDYTNESGTDVSNGMVTASVTYYILLGHNSDSQFTDFNTLRNWNYTYNVKINGIKDITVEVNKKNELRPDAEGDVIVMEADGYFWFDSHYGQSEFRLTAGEIRQLYKNGLLCYRSVVPAYDVDESFKVDVNNNVNGNWAAYDEVTGAKLADNPYDKRMGDHDRNTLSGASANWVRFYETSYRGTASAAAAQYNWTTAYGETQSNGNSKLFTIYRFLWRLKGIAESTTVPDDQIYWFTIFVEENYYSNRYIDRVVKAHGTANQASQKISWHDFVNVPDRKLLLFPTKYDSSDKNSSFSNPRIVIAQRSIRTVYNPLNRSLLRAWGTESHEEYLHQPEKNALDTWASKAPDWATARRTVGIGFINATNDKRNWYHGQAKSTANPMSGTKRPDLMTMTYTLHKYGRFAGFRYLKGKKWADVLDLSSKYMNNSYARLTGSIFPANKKADGSVQDRNNMYDNQMPDIIAACMGRNRDLNGNGTIDADEIRWYVPAIEQLQSLYMGNRGLPTEARLYQKEANAGKWIYKHYYSASREHRDTGNTSSNSNTILWAEEGPSTGRSDNSYAYVVNVRCVRDLDVSPSDTTSAQWSDWYKKVDRVNGNAAGYVDITEMDLNCTRNALAWIDQPGVVTTFNNGNRPARQFEYAKTSINKANTVDFKATDGTIYQFPDYTQPGIVSINDENAKSENTPQRQSLCAQTWGTGWRTPTITEVGLMYWAGVFDNLQNYMSRTRFWLYNDPYTGALASDGHKIKKTYGQDISNGRYNDQSGRDPHAFTLGFFRLRYPQDNLIFPTNGQGLDYQQIGGHWGEIRCVRDKLN